MKIILAIRERGCLERNLTLILYFSSYRVCDIRQKPAKARPYSYTTVAEPLPAWAVQAASAASVG